MKSAVSSHVAAQGPMPTYLVKPEWDTPPHGDFASYVERLTAPKPAISASPSIAPLSAAPAQAMASAQRAPVADGSALSVDLRRSFAPFLNGLRVARVVLLVLALAHGAALMLWGWGSLVGLLIMAGLWWGLGGLSRVAATVLQAPANATGMVLKADKKRLGQMGSQRQSGKKKQ